MADSATYIALPSPPVEEGHTPPKQRPTVFWIGCCDARVSEAAVLPGEEVFVHRNIANQFQAIDPNALASLAHAVSLSTIRRIMVVGHTDCGGVNASLDTAEGHRPPLHWSLFNWLHALTALAKANPGISREEFTKLNVRVQVANVRAALGLLGLLNPPPDRLPLELTGHVYDIAKGELVKVDLD